MVDQLFSRIADPAYVADLEHRSPDEIRAMRAECQVLEDRVSFLRRLTQGRLDIVRSELARRSNGSRHDLGDVIASLPETLAGGVGGGSRQRHAHDADLADLVDATTALDAICPSNLLGNLPTLDDGQLERTIGDLTTFEHEVSDRRRVVFSRLDALADELARRYRNGEASVDALLR